MTIVSRYTDFNVEMSMEQTIPWYCFDRQASDPDYLIKVDRQSTQAGGSGKIYCRFCRQVITDKQQGISQNGAHIHLETNPAGLGFRFACYREAPGCTNTGPVSNEHSWFAAHSWQVALCSVCGEHLGWMFTGGSRFYGLITNRLVDEDETSTDSNS